MGATSVTGVGHGSVEGLDQGRKEYTVAASRLVGPRVVACDAIALAGTNVYINLPFLPTVPNEFAPTVPESATYPAGSYVPETYAVVVTDNGVISGGTAATGATLGGNLLIGGTLAPGAVTAAQATMNTVTDSAGNQYTQLIITGTANHQYSYMIVKQGLMP